MDAAVPLSATPHGIPEGRHMIPGETYVGILPGHTQPAFVRKRPVDAGRPPLLLTRIFGSSRRAYSVEASRTPNMFCRPRRSSDYYYDYATAKYRRKVYVNQSPGRTITSVQQTCASCGKFRSARWQAQHPLIPGKESPPSLCGRCRNKHTSSEEERPWHRRRRHHHHRRCVCTGSTDDSCNTSWESRRGARRHHSYSRDYRRRSPGRSPHSEKVRIIIANQAGDRIRSRREETRSSSMEPVRVIRRREVVDLPERLPRSRSILRSSSHVEYVDSETECIENLDPPRYLPKPRTSSRVSYIEEMEQPRYRCRPRNLSQVSYIEQRSRHRSRPRSGSRVTYIEDSDVPRSRSRHRARSSSQVRFVDETDEPVSSYKPRRLKRRRVVYFDGPADAEISEDRAYSCTPSSRRSLQEVANGDHGEVLIKGINLSSTLASGKSTDQDWGATLIEGQSTAHRHTSPPSQEVSSPIPETVSDHNYRQRSETGSYAYGSDHEATPRPALRYAQVIQSPDDVEEPPSHHSSYPEFKGGSSKGICHSPTLESQDPSRQRTFTGPETPYEERRRRVRDSDESSSSDDDNDYPRPSFIRYRHVEAPEPPPVDRTSADLLVEMLRNATITPPPSTQYEYARGRSSHRNRYYSEPATPSRSCPSEESADGHAGYGTGYGAPSPHEPGFKSSAEEYNWMM